jgi:hypothetical protein
MSNKGQNSINSRGVNKWMFAEIMNVAKIA